MYENAWYPFAKLGCGDYSLFGGHGGSVLFVCIYYSSGLFFLCIHHTYSRVGLTLWILTVRCRWVTLTQKSVKRCYTTAFDIFDYQLIDLVLLQTFNKRPYSVISFRLSQCFNSFFHLNEICESWRMTNLWTSWHCYNHWISTTSLPAWELSLVYQTGILQATQRGAKF